MDKLQVVAGAACDYGQKAFVVVPRPVRASRSRAAVGSWSHLWPHPSTFPYVHWCSA